MRILIITDEVWNDKLYPNNVLTNWFEGFPGTLANIYLAGGIPDNPCCKLYYQVADGMMIKSLFRKIPAGKMVSFPSGQNSQEACNVVNNPLPQSEGGLLTFIKTRLPLEFLRLIKDCIWLKGKYDIKGLNTFIDTFKPDVIFSLRYASLKVLHFERLLLQLTNKPLFVFTGDDEYTLSQLSFSPFYWLRRIIIRNDLKMTASLYSKYYTLSEQQALLYEKEFQTDAGVLRKCSTFLTSANKPVHKPITIVYAGRLYCNRYKTLLAIKKALNTINRNKIHMVLNIYSRDRLSKKYLKLLDDKHHSFLYPPISPEELKRVYQKADIALHVESFDLKNRLKTKYSFSTKIIDCLSSSCAVLAVCPKSHAGYDYLKNQDSAICASSIKEIEPTLKKILKNKSVLKEYQKKAWSCGQQYHQKELIQQVLLKDMQKAAGLNK